MTEKVAKNGKITEKKVQFDAEIIYLGNIYGPHIHDGYGGAVFSKYGLCPAIKTCQGGNRQPIILEQYD